MRRNPPPLIIAKNKSIHHTQDSLPKAVLNLICSLLGIPSVHRAYAIRFASPQGFDGAWEGVFAAEGENTRVTFTETVTTPSLIGRILARLFAPPGAHIDRYLADLTSAVEKP